MALLYVIDSIAHCYTTALGVLSHRPSAIDPHFAGNKGQEIFGDARGRETSRMLDRFDSSGALPLAAYDLTPLSLP